jgi:hypothetical protein
MNLYEQGMRFVVRVVESRIEADWMHQTEVKPEWLDCTDMDDETFCEVMERMRQRVRQGELR